MNLTNLLDLMKTDITALTKSEQLIASLVVTLLSMCIVFVVLMVIMAAVKIMTKSSSKSEKEKEQMIVKKDIKQDIKQDQDNKEIVAVIGSAIACALNTTTNNIVIKKIKRSENSDSSWSKLGRIEQMSSMLGGYEYDKKI